MALSGPIEDLERLWVDAILGSLAEGSRVLEAQVGAGSQVAAIRAVSPCLNCLWISSPASTRDTEDEKKFLKVVGMK